MKRLFALCLLLPFAGAILATPPPSASAQPETDPALQQQMAALQTRMNDLARRMAALSARIGDDANASALRYLTDRKRGMFGMAVSPAADGLRVDAVTPGGPAQRAGVRAGDTITAINGKPVAARGTASATPLSHATVGTPIALSVEHDGKTRELRVTPERFQPDDWQEIARQAEQAASQATARVRSSEFQQQLQQSIDEAMNSADAAIRNATAAHRAAIEAGGWSDRWLGDASPWWGLNLAPLNPDLGRYFGTDRGVLVLSRNDRQFPELQPGDVITKVAGRSVLKPEDVLRALRDASADSRVTVALRRRGKAVALAMRVPSRWNLLPPPPPPPPPPTPPSPTAPTPPSPPAAPPPPSAGHAS